MSDLAVGALMRIDLVAEDRHGDLWAIQAKAYDAVYRVTKRDVDTFLAESGRPQFAFRFLIATTDLIGHTAKRTIEAQQKQASVLLLGDLEAAEVDWPASPVGSPRPTAAAETPKPHQRQAIDRVVTGFERLGAAGEHRVRTPEPDRVERVADRHVRRRARWSSVPSAGPWCRARSSAVRFVADVSVAQSWADAK